MGVRRYEDGIQLPTGWVTLWKGPFGTYILKSGGKDILVQTDWDFPRVATNLGWTPCRKCRETDGTVNCEHRTASDMIAEAKAFLDRSIGRRFRDPGYF